MIRHRNAFLWGAGAILALIGNHPVRADEKSDTLLKEVQTATRAVKTLTADLSMSESFKGTDGKDQSIKMAATLRLKKPNLARIDFAEGGPAKTVASDGKSIYTLMPDNQYQKMTVDAQGKNITLEWAAPVSMFFTGQFSLFGTTPPATTTYLGKQTIEGTEYDVVQLSDTKPFAYTGKLYINSAKLATRLDLEIKQADQTVKLDAILKNVKVDASLADTAFAYELPKGATEYKPPTLEDMNKKLLAVNSVAPNFVLSSPNEGKVELAQILKGKKAVLVNFWFYG